MSILRSRRQSVLAGGVVAIVTVFMFAVSASASIPPGTQFLPGDNFEIDGNKAVDNSANTDWATSTLVVATATDLAKSPQDNSFGQGTKEDTPVPTVVDGSIPPNKSDFSEFQAASREAANGDTLLYLDWTRTNAEYTDRRAPDEVDSRPCASASSFPPVAR